MKKREAGARGTSLPSRARSYGAKTISLIAAGVLAAAIFVAPGASADTLPADPTNPASPETVSADALPTVQIDGVVWQQVIIGKTVYAAGSFKTARPAGAPAGTNTVPRNNILAFDLETGNLLANFAPSLNAEARSIAASPDGTKLYVGGSFTNVNGVSVNNIVALDPTNGAVIPSFKPLVGSRVNAIVATADRVYAGGWFTTVGSAPRARLAAFAAADGGLLPWNPSADNGAVNALVLSPNRDKLVVGGAFTSVNGSSNPGYGLAAVDTTTGAVLPFAANSLVRNGGSKAAVLSLKSDGTSVYGTGYVFGAGGNLEGSFSADWADGKLNWLEDCHGDSYDVYPSSNAVYIATHAHACDTVGGFPETNPRTNHHGLAFTKPATRTLTATPHGGYFNFGGTPGPSLLNWFPDFTIGTYTGQNQGPWSITGNGRYVVMGGEFLAINGQPQQGLVRFATKDLAPNKRGPMSGGKYFTPSATSVQPGTVRVTWPANWDQDNEVLQYEVVRDGKISTPIHKVAGTSSFFDRPTMRYTDSGLVPGATHSYRIYAKDGFGNVMQSTTSTVTVAAESSSSPYANTVLADGATNYWRLGEADGPTAFDWAGVSDLTLGAGVTRNGESGIISDPNKSTSFGGNSTGTAFSSGRQAPPKSFTAEAWVRTDSQTGGKILGFGSSTTTDSGSYDRHVYMTNDGKLIFGVYPNGVRHIESKNSYNDGVWHHVVATAGPSGMQLFVDGIKVASRTDTTSGQDYEGYWRVGGDSLNGWPSQPTSSYFAGAIDEVAIYPGVLTRAQIERHYQESGRVVMAPAGPPDDYGKKVVASDPLLYWRLDESGGSVAKDSGSEASDGIFLDGVQHGVPGAISGLTNTAARFDGQTGMVASSQRFSNPTVYSLEAWFKTSSNAGGKIIGFGDRNDGLSNNYDRHVYMENSGAITFGVWTGEMSTLTTPAAYNDDTWHHVVAQQSAAGMALFVDGRLLGSNSQTRQQTYDGYWKVGADRTWGGQPYFAGDIDEVAVYPASLTAEQVSQHYVTGAPAPVNSAPVAAFSSVVSDLSVAFDGSMSADAEGPIASYAWEFGDGSTGEGAKPSHVFAAAGTYSVKLVVKDAAGAVGEKTGSVTVTAAAPADPQVLAKDRFERVLSGSLGTAEAGGTWTLSGAASLYAVEAGRGVISTAAGRGPGAYLNAVKTTNADTTVDWSVDKLPSTGTIYTTLIGRKVGTSEYRAKSWITSSGTTQLQVTKVVNGVETVISSSTPAGRFVAGDTLRVRISVQGVSPTTVSAKMWKVGQMEPAAWQLNLTDPTSELQTAGGVGILTYLSASTANGPIRLSLDNWLTR